MHKDKIITAVFRELICGKCRQGVYRYNGWQNTTRASDNNYVMQCPECGDSFRAAHPYPTIVYKGRTFRLEEMKTFEELGLFKAPARDKE